jgi:hypothetical protein
MMNGYSKPMSSEEERRLSQRELMPFPPVAPEEERKIESFKYQEGLLSGYYSH